MSPRGCACFDYCGHVALGERGFLCFLKRGHRARERRVRGVKFTRLRFFFFLGEECGQGERGKDQKGAII